MPSNALRLWHCPLVMLEASGFSKSLRNVLELDALSFTTRNDSVTALNDRNGAGKSPTLRILYTVMRPDSGNIRIDSFDTVSETRQIPKWMGTFAVRGACSTCFAPLYPSQLCRPA